MTERELRLRLDRTELVAEHWRRAGLEWNDATGRALAHSQFMVLAAINGESDPRRLGVDPESEEFAHLEALRPDCQ